jgi:hypothetical protein
VSSNDVTRLLSIRVRDANPEQASRIANGIASVLIAQNGSQQAGDESQLTVVDAAEPNLAPVSPNKPVSIILGITGAMLLVSAIIFLIEISQGHVRTEHDLRDVTGAPSLGSFRMTPSDPGSDAFLADDGKPHPVPQRYRLASRKLLAGLGEEADGRTLLVCAPTSTPLTAEVSAYLAAAIAQAGLPTLAIDADPATRGLTRFFGLNGGPGFANLVAGWEAPQHNSSLATIKPPTPTEAVRQLRISLHAPREIPGLFVVSSGPQEVAASASPDRLRATVEALGQMPAVTIVSGPPMASAADALVLADSADVVVLVAVGNETRAADLTKAIENLALVNAKSVWTLLVHVTAVDRWRRWNMRRSPVTPQLIESNMTLEAARRTPAPVSSPA